MMDIVERLRYEAKTARKNHPETFCVSEDTAEKAADEIERLRLALQDIANFPLHGDYSNAYEMPTIAARALAGKIEEAK